MEIRRIRASRMRMESIDYEHGFLEPFLKKKVQSFPKVPFSPFTNVFFFLIEK